MRGVLAVVVAAGSASAACGSVTHPDIDAAGGGSDAPVPDAGGCQPKLLLAGGSDVAAQGWSVVMQAPAQLTSGPDYTKLTTTTAMGATTSGQLLLNYPGAVEPGKPFQIQVVMLVEAVSTHNQLDAGAAIMGSYTPAFGTGTERSQMIYLDAGRLGWADDTATFLAAVVNNAYHTYELAVDAAGMATFRVDGALALSRAGFTTNGAIAVGDQTNDQGVDSTLRIRSITRLCP